VAATREHLHWNHAPFEIPEAVYRAWDGRTRGKALESEWNGRFAEYEKAFPEEAREFRRRVTANDLPANWPTVVEAAIARAVEKGETMATRKASQAALEAFCAAVP